MYTVYTNNNHYQQNNNNKGITPEKRHAKYTPQTKNLNYTELPNATEVYTTNAPAHASISPTTPETETEMNDIARYKKSSNKAPEYQMENKITTKTEQYITKIKEEFSSPEYIKNEYLQSKLKQNEKMDTDEYMDEKIETTLDESKQQLQSTLPVTDNSNEQKLVINKIKNKFVSHKSIIDLYIVMIQHRYAQGGKLIIEGAGIDINNDIIMFEASGKAARNNINLLKANKAITIQNLAIEQIKPEWTPFKSHFKIKILDWSVITTADSTAFNTKDPFTISPISTLYEKQNTGPINIIAIVIKTEKEPATGNKRAREKITVIDTTGNATINAYTNNMVIPKKTGDILLVTGLKWTTNKTEIVIRGFIINNFNYPGYTHIKKELLKLNVNKHELIQRGPKLQKMTLSEVQESMIDIRNEGLIFEVNAKIDRFEEFETNSDVPKYRLLLRIKDNFRTLQAQAWGGGGAAESIMGYNYTDLMHLKNEENAKFQKLLRNIKERKFKFHCMLRKFRNQLQITIIRGRIIGIIDNFSLLIL